MRSSRRFELQDGAQLREERVARALRAERRRRAVARSRPPSRAESGPGAAGSTRRACPSRRTAGRCGRREPAKRTSPEKSIPSRREGDVAGRVARHVDDVEGDAGDLDRLAACEPDVGSIRRESAGRDRRRRILEHRRLARRHVHRRTGGLGERRDSAEVVPVAVGDEDRAQRRPCAPARAAAATSYARIDDDGLRRVRARRGRRSSSSAIGPSAYVSTDESHRASLTTGLSRPAAG